MSKKTKKSEPFDIDIEFQPASQGNSQRKPSLGFQLVSIGLVGYIIHASKFFIVTGLLPISIAFVVIGFVVLIIETLGKVKFH